MKINKKIALLSSICFITACTSTIYADNNKYIQSQLFKESAVLKNVKGEHEMLFFVEENWDIAEAQLNVILTESSLLDPSYSTISIFVNGQPIHSETLSNNTETKKNYSLKIPLDVIKVGQYNKVEVKTYKTISDKICSDDYNTGNWAFIDKSSNVNMRYSYKKYPLLIKNIKNIFNRIDDSDTLDSAILVSEKDSKAFSSLINVGSYLDGLENVKDRKLLIKNPLDSSVKDKNLIFVGTTHFMPDIYKSLLSADELDSINNNKGIIKVAVSPFNKNNSILICVANNESSLLKATNLLLNEKLMKTIDGDSLVISDTTNVNTLDADINYTHRTLNDLGYEDVMLNGVFKESSDFYFNVPKGYSIEKGSKVKINFKNSNNLKFENSMITIYLNDKPIGSKRLTPEKSNDNSIELSIPENLLGLDSYKMKVEFYLDVDGDGCALTKEEAPWAFISKDSEIKIMNKESNKYSFANYPYPIIKDKQFNNLKVVIPDNLSIKELSELVNLISASGEHIESNKGNISVIKSSEVTDADLKDNLLVYGTPLNNKVLKDINSNLNIKYGNDFLTLESNDKVTFVDGYNSNFASFQSIKSPFNENNSIIAISSTNMPMLSKAVSRVTNSNELYKTSSDTLLVASDGSISSYNISKNSEIEKSKDKKENRFATKEFGVIVGVVGTLVIGFILSAIYISRRYKG